MALELALDCKHYRGDRPCTYRRRCTCEYYEPMGTRILIIKLGALGDVVRTACLLPTLKRLYPESQITWVSRPNGVRILRGHPQIDRLVPFDAEGTLILSQQRFDLVLSLDKDLGPTALCTRIECPDKRGMRMSPMGTVEPCDARCEPYFALGLDDDLKFLENAQTYPELIHGAVGLDYVREPYRLYCGEGVLERARAMFEPWRHAVRGPLIGLNTGAGTVFANKSPRTERWVEIARGLIDAGCGAVLLGGPAEAESNARVLGDVGDGAFSAGCDNTESEFVAVVDTCDAVVTGDTFGLHVAVARQLPVVALFGPTCDQEIDLFDLGRKIVATCDCGPCYRRTCDKKPNCMDSIPISEIVEAALAVCRAGPTADGP